MVLFKHPVQGIGREGAWRLYASGLLQCDFNLVSWRAIPQEFILDVQLFIVEVLKHAAEFELDLHG